MLLRSLLALTLLHVSVAEDPKLELMPNKIMKQVGDGVYVSCQAQVTDPELVTEMAWFDPQGERIPAQEGTVMVTEDGMAGKLDLLIQKLQDQNTGNYTCTATYATNQKLSATILVQSFLSIDFGDTPVHQTPILHTEGKIKCTPTSRPSAQIDWLKDGVPLKNDENHIIQQDGVLIKNVTKMDEGTYRCRAKVILLGSILHRDIQVEVYMIPVITNPPVDLRGAEHDSAVLECGAEGNPAPTYSWVDKDNRVLDEGVEGFMVDQETGKLTVVSLEAGHTGTYRCTASNAVGEDVREAYLQVLTHPKVERYLNITATEGDEGELRCAVRGEPAPKVVFKKEVNEESFADGINQDDRISVEQITDEEGLQVGILKIRSLTRDDDGLYTCTASSEGGVEQAWGHITVEFKPTFEEQSFVEIWSWEQKPVNLSCLATSIPNATVQWYFRNQEIDPSDENLRVLSLGPLGVLNVNPLSPSYFGQYTCQATNIHGTTELDLELKEAHTPGPISHAEVTEKTATTLSWSLTDPADNGGLQVQGYRVEYRPQDLPWDDAHSLFWTKGSTYTIDKLSPAQIYIFRFAARNDAGIGEWGGEKSVEMPTYSAPEEPQIFNVQGPVREIPYPDHFILQWAIPLDNGKEIDSFQISYYQVQNTSGTWEPQSEATRENVMFPGETEYTLEPLASDTYYKIELRAHNEIGFSTPAEIIIKTAHGPPASEASSDEGLGVGVVVAIVVVVLVVLVIIMDITCYFTKNAGITATIAGKRTQNDKDKEAMLEDGKNASSDDTLNDDHKETKPSNEKSTPEKEPLKPSDPPLHIKSEKEPEEKHEGNGQMKPQKEDAIEGDDKNKEAPEVTETTPMIQGEKEDKEAIKKEEEQKKEEGELKKSSSKSSITKDSPV